MRTVKQYTPEDFAWTQWHEVDFISAYENAVKKSEEYLSALKAVPVESRTYENTIFALEMAYVSLEELVIKVQLLLNVSPEKEIRDSAQRIAESMYGALSALDFDDKVYKALTEYKPEAENLSAPDQRMVEYFLRSYRRRGFGRDEHIRSKVKENNKRLIDLGFEFDAVLNNWQESMLVSPEEVSGLPANYLEGLARDDAGNYIVTLKYPEYFPFIEYADNAAKRKELIDKFFARGGQKNIDILAEMLTLRAESAHLLGYKNHAEFILEVKMAKNPATVQKFFDDLIQIVKPQTAKDIQALTECKKLASGNPDAQIEYFDAAYFSQVLQKQLYALDNSKVQEYFPVEHVFAEMFKLYNTLLSVQYEKLEGYPTWHPDVEVYAVRNFDGAIISYFLLDLYPRDGKYGHASHFETVVGHTKEYNGSEYEAQISTLIANFTKPLPGKRSLLTHKEVKTLFHEFGHVMHACLSTATHYVQSGTRTARDFSEAPSQMLENWIWDKDILKKLSKHYVTGESLSDETIDAMLRAKGYMNGHFYMRQIVLGLFDFKLHTEEQAHRIVELYNELMEGLVGVGLRPDHTWPGGFAHIAGHEYDVGYYGYLWSEVYAADMFSRFEQEGVMNVAVGREYRDKILAVGSSRDELESVKDFLGRPVSNEPFLKVVQGK